MISGNIAHMSDIECPECGAAWPTDLDMVLCGKCGTELEAPATDITDKERRTLTVLFADLSGYTTFSEGKDPEDVEGKIDELFADLGGVVHNYGGYVDKYMGDAVMAVFGAPDAHEDDPLRAVRTAIDMFDVVGDFNQAHNESLALSVGINHGQVIWSQVGGAEFTVTGDAVTVAQHLESAAESATILVSRSVEKQTRDFVVYERQKGIEIPGRDTTVQAFTVSYLQEREPGQPGEQTEFVGRQEELEKLVERYERHQADFLVITGEAGIGKSRLLEQFESALENREETVFVGRGHSRQHAKSPYEPFGDILLLRAETTRDNPDAGTHVAAAIVEDLANSDHHEPRRENIAHLMAISVGFDVPEARVTEMPSDRMQEEIRLAWATWLRHVGRTQPVVLLFEDLQWAEESTVKMLQFLKKRLDSTDGPAEGNTGEGDSTYLIGTSRSDESVPAGFDEYKLNPLEPPDSRAIAESILGEPADDDLARYLHERSGGNPYFVEELLRYLTENDLLERSGEHYTLPKQVVLEARVPDTLTGLLIGRIDALDPRARETLKVASVIGEHFWEDVLRGVIEEGSREALLELIEREMVYTRDDSTIAGDTEYGFKHSMLRDAVYGLLPKSTAEELHREVSKRIEEVARETSPPNRTALSVAARQSERAEAYERACNLWSEAGILATQEYANQEAIEHYERAVEFGRKQELLTPVDEARLFANLAEIYEKAGDLEAAWETVEAGLTIGADDTRVECRLHGILATVAREMGELDEAYEAAQRQLEQASSLGIRELEPEALYELGWVAVFQSRYDDALHHYEEGVTIAREVGDRTLEASNLKGVGNVRWQQGDYEAARNYYEESLAISQEIGDQRLEGDNRNNLGIVAGKQSEFFEARVLFEGDLAISRSIGDRSSEMTSLLNLAEIAQHRGAFDQAKSLLDESLSIAQEMGAKHTKTLILNHIAQIAAMEGSVDRAVDLLDESLSIAKEIESPYHEGHARLEKGKLCRTLGKFEKSRTLLHKSLDIFIEAGEKSFIAETRFEIASLEYQEGYFDQAHELIISASDMFEQLSERHMQAKCQRLFGDIAASTDEMADARHHWETALSTFMELNMIDDALITLRKLDTTFVNESEHHARAQALVETAPPATRRLHDGWIHDGDVQIEPHKSIDDA